MPAGTTATDLELEEAFQDFPIEIGDVLKVDTRSGEYVSRAKD